ncbi:hypothetical protein ACU8KH_05543 [Lachancea thermotolerans]
MAAHPAPDQCEYVIVYVLCAKRRCIPRKTNGRGRKQPEPRHTRHACVKYSFASQLKAVWLSSLMINVTSDEEP